MEKEWKREVDELKVQAWGKVHGQGLDRKGGGRKPGRRKVRWAEVREKGASRRGGGSEPVEGSDERQQMASERTWPVEGMERV